MSLNLGFKALAYPVSNLSDPVSPCQCSLAFRCDDATKEATILLVAEILTPHATQTFVLQYDADELVSGAVSLSSGNKHLTRPQLDELLRDKDNKRSDIKTLALSVKQPCPLWCPGSSSFAHRPGFEPSFQDFVDLSKATTIHIVFDYKYLRKQYQGMFRAFSKAAKGLTGYPVRELLVGLGLKQASWDLFGPADAAGAPPAYDGPRKRPRQTSSTSPSRSPKRFAPQSPTESHASDKTIPLSPSVAEAFRAALRENPSFDYQTEAINAAINKQLPSCLEKVLPSLLSDILPTLFASPSNKSLISSPRTYLNSSGTPSPEQPPLPPLTPLCQSLLPHLRLHLQDQFQQYQTHQLDRFQKLLDRLWDSAEGARAHETAEMIDEMEEHKTDILLMKADAVKELSVEIDAVFDKGREDCWDLSNNLAERIERVFGEMCDNIESLKRTRVKKIVAFEVRKYGRQRKRVPPQRVGKSQARIDQKLLGRKREAEWVDC